jgi:hypothetical protein
MCTKKLGSLGGLSHLRLPLIVVMTVGKETGNFLREVS